MQHETTCGKTKTSKCFYLHDHLDGGQRGRDVLWVRRSHRDRNATGVKAAVKRHDEVDTWRRGGAGGDKEEDREGGGKGGVGGSEDERKRKGGGQEKRREREMGSINR